MRPFPISTLMPLEIDMINLSSWKHLESPKSKDKPSNECEVTAPYLKW